ncbi:sensor histidine kinase [Leptospira sp. 96542]|nr:sensor histidine kinase [Leptospira sp. 96542]
MDLRNYSLNNDSIIPLAGEWKFYWKEFIPPEENNNEKNQKFIFKQSPSVWNDTNFYGEKIGSFGYASYQLNIQLAPNSESLAIYVPDLGTAYKLFVNGEEVSKAGIISVTKEFSKPQYLPQTVILPKSDRLNIVIHISNYQNLWGGYWYPIELGKAENIIRNKQFELLFSITISATAGVMACYNLLLYAFRRKELSPLLFAIHCLCILLRTLTTGERFGHIFFPDLSWEFLNRLEYLSIFISVPILYEFLYHFSPNQFWKRFGHYFNFPIYLMCLFIIFTPNFVYAKILNPILVYCFLVLIPCWMFLLVIGITKKKQGAWVLFLGYFGLMATNVNDILLTFGLIQSVYLIPFGQFFIIVSQSILVSKQFSNSFTKSENLTLQLKSLVTSTQRILSSSNITNAISVTLDILRNYNYQNKLTSILLYDQAQEHWNLYCLQENERLKVTQVESVFEIHSQIVDFTAMSEIQFIGENLYIPIYQNEKPNLILDVPSKPFKQKDTDVDWIKGIAYALSLSLLNIQRQNREKLAIIGELSSEIAHDISHHIIILQNIIKNFNDKDDHDSHTKAVKEIESLTNLTLDILEFSKNKIILDLQELNMNDYFLNIKEDLKLFFENTNIKLEFSIQTDLTMKFDPLRIRRVFLNIAKNALEAMNGNGLFKISIEVESNSLYMIFRDEGPGFTEEIKKSFYHSEIVSNKSMGNGFGLSIVRKIIHAHNGQIFLDSNENHGARITIILPIG